MTASAVLELKRFFYDWVERQMREPDPAGPLALVDYAGRHDDPEMELAAFAGVAVSAYVTLLLQVTNDSEDAIRYTSEVMLMTEVSDALRGGDVG